MTEEITLYAEIVADINDCGFDARINDLDESLEINYQNQWLRMTDTLEAVLKTELRERGYSSGRKPSLSAARDVLTTLAHNRRYNPILAYFDEIRPRYTPLTNPHLIPTLATYFENPDGWFGTWLLKWMIGTVAKLKAGERNPMLVMVGPQQTGKSYFAKWLCPPALGDRFIKSSINPDNKDSIFRLCDTFIWEVEELGATTRRADIESLKAFITKPFIFERPPYGRHPIYKPVSASFIGTVNYDGAGFLNDPTGSTRFLSCEVGRIDFDYTVINVDTLWAEALWFYEHVPNSWQLAPAEKEAQALINAQFEVASALADVIEARFNLSGAAKDFLTTQQIKTQLEGYYRFGNEQAFYNELGRVLTKFGLARGRSNGVRGWTGISVKSV
jgi:predicted P-loop ATPase